MTRRDAGWLVVRAAATIAGQNFFASWMSAAAHEHGAVAPPEPERWNNYKPQFFSREEFGTLESFTAILIPTDETPGAREAHVAPFIDFVVFSAAEYAPEMQSEWRRAMAQLKAHRFGALDPAGQLSFIEEMSVPESEGFSAFRLIKQMTVYAFYTSRAGLIDNLEYKGIAYLTEFPGCTHPEHHRA
jgi:Gluconate 2-dehydrogenase subunit 3